MTDAGFVIAAYVVVFGTLVAYAYLLRRRSTDAERVAASIANERKTRVPLSGHGQPSAQRPDPAP